MCSEAHGACIPGVYNEILDRSRTCPSKICSNWVPLVLMTEVFDVLDVQSWSSAPPRDLRQDPLRRAIDLRGHPVCDSIVRAMYRT